jgi:tRNA(Arg) A34 adenosine deaminase TadA
MARHRYTIVAHCYDKRGRLLACATNSYTKTHPLQSFFAEKVGHPAKQFLHAEIAALLRCKDKQVHMLKVWRYGKDGKLLCAKPCVICQEAIQAFKPTEVWYSDFNTMVKL